MTAVYKFLKKFGNVGLHKASRLSVTTKYRSKGIHDKNISGKVFDRQRQSIKFAGGIW